LQSEIHPANIAAQEAEVGEITMRKHIVSLLFVATCALHANPNFAQSAASGAQAAANEPVSPSAPATPGSTSRSVTRTEALQASMLALMNDAYMDRDGKALYSYAHPMFWAPYALVGDSGR